jgi:hypothetical protein
MNEPKPIQEAQREAEVRQALTLSDGEKMQIKQYVDWHVEGIENVVQRALYDKVAPLLLRMWKEIDRQDNAIERLKRDIRRK